MEPNGHHKFGELSVAVIRARIHLRKYTPSSTRNNNLQYRGCRTVFYYYLDISNTISNHQFAKERKAYE